MLRVHDITCAVGLGDVREVQRAAALSPLPNAPAVIDGVLNLRGELIPVLNLRRRFRLPESALSPSEHFVIVRAGTRTVALRADRADDIVDAEAETLNGASANLPDVGSIAGAVKTESGVVFVHDVAAFLTQAESVQLDAAFEASAR